MKHRRVIATVANRSRLCKRYAQVFSQGFQGFAFVGQHRGHVQIHRLRTRHLGQPLHFRLQLRFQLHQQLGVVAGGDDLVDPVQVRLETLHHYRPIAQAIGFALHHGPGRITAQPVAIGKHPDFHVRLGRKQRQGDQCRFRRQMVSNQDAAIRVDQRTAIEASHWHIDAKRLDQMPHGLGRTPAGQAEKHPGLAHGANGIGGALAEAVVGMQ